jgi:hypothetical protein
LQVELEQSFFFLLQVGLQLIFYFQLQNATKKNSPDASTLVVVGIAAGARGCITSLEWSKEGEAIRGFSSCKDTGLEWRSYNF